MPKTADFYSVNEFKKPVGERVYHNNSACAAGQDIRPNDKRYGQNGYRLCDDCVKLNKDGK